MVGIPVVPVPVRGQEEEEEDQIGKQFRVESELSSKHTRRLWRRGSHEEDEDEGGRGRVAYYI